MSKEGRGVFLSYASQDTEAARRICDALRQAGIEVWFDQAELRGGDAWDEKIRQQVKDCVLFVPVISANTQMRREGYFRLEWKLAAQRTHTMAHGTPFLLPVVIDTTRDAEALVPPEFKDVQWTRLANGEPSESFVERIATLLRCGLVAGVPTALGDRRESAEQRTGDRVGHYKLLEKLGEGGCGVVWMAEQEEPVRRRVALKVIKLGMDTKEVIARFETERQVLAMLDHPNIAKVFDAGTTDTGRPYFVMELVRGLPITAFCDERRLGTAARVELVIQVCHAIQHAHQKGIIHRDIKPSNILVSLQEDVAVPKVIDFGIAKATAGSLTDQTVFTAVDQFIGTPAYMSPEQAQLSMRDVDTRSDIYSLGVLLYELLTGWTPFDTKQLLAIGLDEMRRYIREVDPPRPSTRLSTLGIEALNQTAQHRQVATRKLVQGIRGELDWIVMRCLEKDRARRYPTANGLANDLSRHLVNEPISAGPPAATYRFKKFVMRHRLAFAAATLVALTLVLGVIVSTWQAVRANRAERAASTEAAISRAVNDFVMSDLLAQADSRAQADGKAAPNPDLKVREALDRAGRTVGTRFATQPITEAAVRDAIGSAYEGVGDYGKAAQHHERALELRKRALGPRHPDTMNSMSALAVALQSQGKFAEAEKMHAETLELRKGALGNEHPATLASMNNLGMAYYSQGKMAEAVALFAETLDKRTRVLGPEHSDTLKVMNNLANAYRALAKYAEAAALLARTLDIRKRTLGPEHPFTLTSMNNLALTYQVQGKFAEAIELNQQTLEIRRRTLGAEHPETLGSANNLALTFAARGDFAEAATLHAQVLEVQKRILGREHPNTLASMNNLASAMNGQGRFKEAELLHVQTLEIRRRVLGPEHRHTLLSMNNLGETQLSQRKYAEAATLHAETLAIRKRILGPQHPETLTSMHNLALSYQGAGRLADAIPLFEEAFKLRQTKLGLEHIDTRTSQASLAEAYRSAGRNADAATLLEQKAGGSNSAR